MFKKLSAIYLSIIISLTVFTYVLACGGGCGCSGSHNHGATVQPTDTQVVDTDVYGEIQESTATQNVEEKVQCPVMKNWILPSEASDSVEYNGTTYYFCCGGCKEKFLLEPEKYISEI